MENIVPKHIALIMDGNRRWAKGKGLKPIVGHMKGYRKIEEIVKHAKKLGIRHITFWAFSTENWKRDKAEIDGIMDIFRKLFKKNSLQKIIDEGAKIVVFGDITKFPEDIQTNIEKVIQETADNTSLTVNIALNYGGREEILRAVRLLLEDKPGVVDEDVFSSYLYSHGQPDPDFIIRTGGEQRLSGYLSWQSVYSELYFTKTYWPDFDKKAFAIALSEFASRQRRFGT